MKTLEMSFTRVEGGCTFMNMIIDLFVSNGVSNSVKVKRSWKNDRNIFIINGKKYAIAKNSYIFNYDGYLELEEYEGATRDLSSKCESQYLRLDSDYGRAYNDSRSEWTSEEQEAMFFELLK